MKLFLLHLTNAKKLNKGTINDGINFHACTSNLIDYLGNKKITAFFSTCQNKLNFLSFYFQGLNSGIWLHNDMTSKIDQEEEIVVLRFIQI